MIIHSLLDVPFTLDEEIFGVFFINYRIPCLFVLPNIRLIETFAT